MDRESVMERKPARLREIKIEGEEDGWRET